MKHVFVKPYSILCVVYEYRGHLRTLKKFFDRPPNKLTISKMNMIAYPLRALDLTSFWFYEGVSVAYLFNFLCCVFCFVFILVRFLVLNVACVSRLSIIDCILVRFLVLNVACVSRLSIIDCRCGFL
jgi:hypothetical protein